MRKPSLHLSLMVPSIFFCLTLIIGLFLTSNSTSADDSVTSEVNLSVPVACTMESAITPGEEHAASIAPGTYSGDDGYSSGIGKTTLTAFCNDYNGFSIYAVGFTDDKPGDNRLIGTSATSSTSFATKAYSPGDTTSSWSMKVTKVTDATESYNPANMTIQADSEGRFDAWHSVPSNYAKVAEYKASTGSSATDQGQGALGAKLETTYAAYIAGNQPADTYTGQVKYVMIHPYDDTAPSVREPFSLFDQPNLTEVHRNESSSNHFKKSSSGNYWSGSQAANTTTMWSVPIPAGYYYLMIELDSGGWNQRYNLSTMYLRTAYGVTGYYGGNFAGTNLKTVIFADYGRTPDSINSQAGVTINSTSQYSLSRQKVIVDISAIDQDMYVGWHRCDNWTNIYQIVAADNLEYLQSL